MQHIFTVRRTRGAATGFEVVNMVTKRVRATATTHTEAEAIRQTLERTSGNLYRAQLDAAPTAEVACRDCGTLLTVPLDGDTPDALVTHKRGRTIAVCSGCVRAAQRVFNAQGKV